MPQRVRLDVGLVFNSAFLGEIPIETDTAGNAAVDVSRLRSLLSPLVEPAIIADLDLIAAGRVDVPVSEFSGPNFQLSFDLSTLRLIAVVPQSETAVARISVTEGVQTESDVTPPADFAFGITATVLDRYVHQSFLEREGRTGAQASLRGFANLGGYEGFYLTFDTGLRDVNDRFGRLVDGDQAKVTIFYDDVGRAVRYAAGSAEPTVFGSYQVPIRLVGFSVDRLYQTIQPYRNLRPSGRGALTLERESRVNVVVNGQIQRTLLLGPGRYDLRDFPFLNGLNDVRLVVEDATGRREAASLSFFSDIDLLNPGVSNFSAAVGISEDDLNLVSGANRVDDVMASGFYQRGINDRLTVGVGFQAKKEDALATAQVIVATQFGLLGAQGAIDAGDAGNFEYAALLSWRQRNSGVNGLDSGFTADLSFESEFFSPLTPSLGVFNGTALNFDARYQRSFANRFYVSAGLGYSQTRGSRGDEYRLSASASRSFRRVTVSATLDQRFSAARGDTRVGISLSVPLSSQTTARARYQSGRNQATVEVDHAAFPGLDQYGYRAASTTSDDGSGFSGDVQYFGNRFQANARHDYSEGPFGPQQVSNVAFTTGIGYAGGRLGWGREADQGFVIVDRHASLERSAVIVRNSASIGPSARTGAFGSALVPLQRPYVRDSVAVEVTNLPMGYDIGAGRLDLLQGAASGYRMQIGSSASNTVVGRIVGPAGMPVALMSGALVPLAGREAVRVEFFTNRTGRLVAQRVAPGRYAVVPAGANQQIAEINVPENATGIVDVGVLVFEGTRP